MMETLRKWKESGSNSCPFIHGARQVGKTTVVEMFGEENYGSFLRIDFVRDPGAKELFIGKLDVDSLMRRITARYPQFNPVPGDTLLFFDEVQECKGARASIKYIVSDGRYDIVASGSLLGVKIGRRKKDGAGKPFVPVGSEEPIHMGPMDFEEFLWALGFSEDSTAAIAKRIKDRNPFEPSVFEDLSLYYRQYMVVGGMPKAVETFVSSPNFNDVRRVHSNILEDYLEDIRNHAPATDRRKIESCLRSLTVQLSRERKKFRYSDVEDGAEKRGQDYYATAIEWLRGSELVVICDNLTEPHLPLEERHSDKAFKLYMRDTGLLLSMYEPDVQWAVLNGDIDVNRGAIVENSVACNLDLCGRVPTYFQTEEPTRMEIDFVQTIDGKVTGIEVKSGKNKRHRSLKKMMEMYSAEGIILETGNIRADEDGVLHLPLFASAFMMPRDPFADNPMPKARLSMDEMMERLS